jgi:hypothetical protein
MTRVVTMCILLFRPVAVFRADHQHALSALDAKITRNLAGDKWHEAKRVIRSGSYSNSPWDSRSANAVRSHRTLGTAQSGFVSSWTQNS